MGCPPLVQALLYPSAYPPEQRSARVDLVETHISYLFLTGQRVYKLKKAVDFGFLGFTTLAKRRHYCKEEPRLNRRMSPSVYLRVATIRQRDGEYTVDGKGRVADYAVVMRQLPADREMRRLLKEGKVTRWHIRLAARQIWRFHQRTESTPAIARPGSPHGGPQERTGEFRADPGRHWDHNQPAGL